VAIGKRVAYVVPLLVGVVSLTFVLLQLAPGDIVTASIGDFPASEEYLAERRAALGLDQPVIVQYVQYLASVFQGDLGYSFANREEVLPLVLERLGTTLLLVLTATAIAVVIGVPAGILAATTRRRSLDNGVNVLALIGFSIPAFWLAQMALLVFALTLGWFPTQGMTTIGVRGGTFDAALDVASHLVLPACVVAVPETALIARITRTSAKSVLDSGYILTAVSKGLAHRSIVRRHVARNALLPTVTVLGYTFGTLVGGSILVETVFGWPGMGSLLYEAILNRDTSVVLGTVVVVAVLTLLVNVVTDIAYGIVDPRIREATSL
jgi:peptide/nickel transport system permease protein